MGFSPTGASVVLGGGFFYAQNGSHDVQIFKLSQYNDDLAKRQSGRLKDSKFSVSYIKEFVSGIIDGQFLDS